MKKFALLIVIAIMLTSCGVKAKKVDNPDKYINKIGYFQDGCVVFGVLEIRKQGSVMIEGIGLTVIPQSELTPEIIAQIKNYQK
jgi:hypothetical protein